MVCASRYRLERGGLTHFWMIFFESEMTCSESQKVGTELGQPPTSHARPRHRDHPRPSKLAAKTLSLVEPTLSKFACDSCTARRGIVATVKCCVPKKARIFSLSGPAVENNERSQRALCGFQHHRGENVFCFLFSAVVVAC